jgi:hypothetical protein
MADDVIEYPDTPFPLDPSLVLLGRRGSEAHGTYLGDASHNGIDDRDLMGVCIPPAPYYLGMQRWEVAEAIKGPWDVVLYEFRKFVGLLCQQNPNVLQLLWLEPEDYLPVPKVNEQLGRELVMARRLFRQEDRARKAFAGYAHGQMKRMTAFDAPAMQRIADLEATLTDLGVDLARAAEGKWDRDRYSLVTNQLCEQYVGMRRTYHKAYMGQKRWKMVQQHGYDVKNAAHLVRLLHLGYEYLTEGRLNVRRTWDVELLLAIKRGEWELQRVQAHADHYFAAIEEATSVLPASLDTDHIDRLVTSLVKEHLSR